MSCLTWAAAQLGQPHAVHRVRVDQLTAVGPTEEGVEMLSPCGCPGGSRRAAAHNVGLVPAVHQSADKAHHGPMTKQGNPELRWILSQWAIRLMKDDPMVREWAQRLRKRVHINKARMALARRLVVGAWIVLTRGEVFDLRRCLGVA